MHLVLGWNQGQVLHEAVALLMQCQGGAIIKVVNPRCVCLHVTEWLSQLPDMSEDMLASTL